MRRVLPGFAPPPAPYQCPLFNSSVITSNLTSVASSIHIVTIMDEYVKPAVETLKPYDQSASKLIKGFGLVGTIGALLIGFLLVLAIKLKLLSKLGYYLGSVRTHSLSQFN